MLPRLAADAVLILHLAFVLFVVLGGVLVLRRPRLAWLHAPAVAWAAFVEFAGRVCPLTPLEITLRAQAGQAVYSGDFIGNYIGSLLYPGSLTRPTQMLLGVGVVLINLAIYAVMLRRRFRVKMPAGTLHEATDRKP